MYESLQETQISSYKVLYHDLTLMPRATVATLSHSISYLLVDSFVSYHPVELVLHVSIPCIPNKAFVSAKSQPATTFHKRTSSVNACAHFGYVTKAVPTNIPF